MPKRACDACKQRKVKCDQLSPTCAPCRLSNLSCTYVIPRRKRGPKPKNRPPDEQGRLGSHMLVASPSSYHSNSKSSPEPFENDASALETVVSEGETPSLPMACHRKLLEAIAKTGESGCDNLVDRCIDFYLGNGFPLAPITLSPLDDDLTPKMLEAVRMYSLIAIVCALVMHSGSLLDGDNLATLFLHASRTTLRLYTHQDLTDPSSTSLSIRMLQAAYHHLDGNPNLAWYSIDEAVGLALQMRLYDESSYEALGPIEAKLRKNAFWQLYTGDRSASLLNNRPLQLDEFRLQTSFTALGHLDHLTPLLDESRLEHQGHFESLILQGFQKGHQVWNLGQAVLFDLRLFRATNLCAGEGAKISPEQERALFESCLRFLSVLDDSPSHIIFPLTVQTTDSKSTERQRRAFWVQNANIMLTYCDGTRARTRSSATWAK